MADVIIKVIRPREESRTFLKNMLLRRADSGVNKDAFIADMTRAGFDLADITHSIESLKTEGKVEELTIEKGAVR